MSKIGMLLYQGGRMKALESGLGKPAPVTSARGAGENVMAPEGFGATSPPCPPNPNR